MTATSTATRTRAMSWSAGKYWSLIGGGRSRDLNTRPLYVFRKEGGATEIVLLDHGLYTQLSNKFRYDYSDFWLAIINRDVDQIKAAADKLGVGELYGLFACMVTARYVA